MIEKEIGEGISIVDIANKLLEVYDNKGPLQKLPNSPNYRRLCPFHEEKTPSFWVWPKSKRYKYHGCGQEGDTLDLVTALKGSREQAEAYLREEAQRSKNISDLQERLSFTR